MSASNLNPNLLYPGGGAHMRSIYGDDKSRISSNTKDIRRQVRALYPALRAGSVGRALTTSAQQMSSGPMPGPMRTRSAWHYSLHSWLPSCDGSSISSTATSSIRSQPSEPPNRLRKLWSKLSGWHKSTERGHWGSYWRSSSTSGRRWKSLQGRRSREVEEGIDGAWDSFQVASLGSLVYCM